MRAEIEFPTFDSFRTWFEETTQNHPFKARRYHGRFYQDFVAGRVSREFLREYARQFYIFIQMTNANVTWTLVNYIDLWRHHPELYNIVAAKMGSELCDPGPGGHGRTYLKYACYLGLRPEELLHAKAIPELEARFNTALLYRSQSPAQTAVRWMLEGFVGYNMQFWRETLRGKYGVPDDVLEYFDLHVEADLGEHGPEGEMLLRRLYELGMVRREDYPGMRAQVVRAVEGEHPGSQTFSWQNVLYERYCASRRGGP